MRACRRRRTNKRAPPLPPSGDRGARSTKTRRLRPFDILLLSHKLSLVARVLITGITGQDGSYLAESHLAGGDEVHGVVRQSSLLQRTRLDSVPALVQARAVSRLMLHYADLCDTSSLVSVLRNVRPDVVYHLAGQSHVKISFDLPEYTADSTGLGTLRLLESMRHVVPECRFFLAATSEIFGEAKESPQTERTPMNPINPYAAAKAVSYTHLRAHETDSYL